MICPLCERKIETETVHDGLQWICPSIEQATDGSQWNHYSKYYISDVDVPFYVEELYLLPYRIENHYGNSNWEKPHTSIYKRELKSLTPRPRFQWEFVLRMDKVVEILKYKKMRARLNTIILMS